VFGPLSCLGSPLSGKEIGIRQLRTRYVIPRDPKFYLPISCTERSPYRVLRSRPMTPATPYKWPWFIGTATFCFCSGGLGHLFLSIVSIFSNWAIFKAKSHISATVTTTVVARGNGDGAEEVWTTMDVELFGSLY